MQDSSHFDFGANDCAATGKLSNAPLLTTVTEFLATEFGADVAERVYAKLCEAAQRIKEASDPDDLSIVAVWLSPDGGHFLRISEPTFDFGDGISTQ
jgi:hypothetical protein